MRIQSREPPVSVPKYGRHDAVGQWHQKFQPRHNRNDIAYLCAVILFCQIPLVSPQLLEQRVRCFDKMRWPDLMEHECVPVERQKPEQQDP